VTSAGSENSWIILPLRAPDHWFAGIDGNTVCGSIANPYSHAIPTAASGHRSGPLVARRFPIFVAPRSRNYDKLAPSAARGKVNSRLWPPPNSGAACGQN
jgi:hypothetical protein